MTQQTPQQTPTPKTAEEWMQEFGSTQTPVIRCRSVALPSTMVSVLTRSDIQRIMDSAHNSAVEECANKVGRTAVHGCSCGSCHDTQDLISAILQLKRKEQE